MSESPQLGLQSGKAQLQEDLSVTVSTFTFRDSWVDLRAFETAFRRGGPHEAQGTTAQFVFPAGCKIMVDAGLRLLSLANQLVFSTKRVILAFEEEEGTLGYLNRIGFFDHLAETVEIIPARPAFSGAEIYRGHAATVVEIGAISPEVSESSLPTRLADALEASVSPARGEAVGKAAFTVLAELIQNIHLHAETHLDGYAALQVYQKGGRAKVAVSDSGKGILETLRPSLSSWNRRAAALSDTALVVEAFRSGLSRHGKSRGCGLQTSANHALRFSAELDVRLPHCRVHLVPSSGEYRPHVAHCSENLPLLWGTHICFDFRLDT